MMITIYQAITITITTTQAIVFYIPRCIWLSMEGGLMNFLVKGTQGRQWRWWWHYTINDNHFDNDNDGDDYHNVNTIYGDKDYQEVISLSYFNPSGAIWPVSWCEGAQGSEFGAFSYLWGGARAGTRKHQQQFLTNSKSE